MPTILTVDDSQFMRKLLRSYLEEIDCKVIEAKNGVEGIEKAQNEKPDCIFLDLLMPDMDGFGVLDELRKLENEIPIIVVSADIQEKTKIRILEYGVLTFMNKPPQKKAIQDIVKRLFG